ncbi:TonB-dependent receptor [Sphingomonas montanisoli]|uniref:TonB-dependent receptor n=1 Tax=Sphingomonas montanisoli TaxID=2606412 RepID=A0A5D9CCP5_9SPHN|nr:TonB-dependent receptor [Sphingomonas montanisoli]
MTGGCFVKSNLRKLACGSAATALALLIAGPAWSQEAAPQDAEQTGGIQDIVVTAQKREQRLQDVPVAISAVTAASLEANRIVSVRDLDSISPNLTVRQIVGGGGLPTYSMRGEVTIGSSIGVDRGIALYVDGVYLANAQGSIFELGDIQRIEVLRGPQGTLFGRNSTGGAVSITTGDPKGEFGAKGTISYGNYDQFRAVAHVDTAKYGDFSAAFSYVHTERRGDIKNLGGGTTWDFSRVGGGIRKSPKHLGGFNTEAASANILYDGPAIRAIYKFDWTDSTFSAPGQGVIYMSPLLRQLYAAQPAANRPNLTQLSKTRPDAVNNAGVVNSRIKNQGHNLTLSGDITDNLSFKNIAAYRRSKFQSPLTLIDGNGGLVNPGTVAMGPFATAFGLLAGGAPLLNANIGAPFLLQPTLTSGLDRQWSDEFQLNYDSEFATLTAGGLYFQQRSNRGSTGDGNSVLGKARSAAFQIYPGFAIPGPRANGFGAIDGHVKVVSKAAFGQAEFHVLDNLDLVAGGRYTHDKKTGIDNTVVSGAAPIATNSFVVDYSKGKFTYNLGANYKVNSDVLMYGKYVTGFISGGQFAGFVFDPETAKSWEGGIKADWWGRKLRTNLSLFTVKYTGLQLTTSGPNIGSTNQNLTQVVLNAGDARAKGFELETTFQPIRELTFNASLGYTNFNYTRIDPRIAAAAAVVVANDRSTLTSALSAQYESEPVWGDANFVVRFDGNYKSKQQKVPIVPLTTGSSALFGINAAEQQAFANAQRIPGYWLVNGRIALQGISMGGSKATLALWGRNLFDTKQVSYAPSLVYAISADYERARTYGVDLTVEF